MRPAFPVLVRPPLSSLVWGLFGLVFTATLHAQISSTSAPLQPSGATAPVPFGPPNSATAPVASPPPAPSVLQTSPTSTLPAPPTSAPIDALSLNDPALEPPFEFTLPEPGQPLPTGEATLEHILETAATSSPAMRQQANTVAQFDASRFRSWTRQLPTLNATYNLGLFYDVSSENAGSSSTKPGGAFSLQASRPLFYWGAFEATTNLNILNEQIAQNSALLAYAKLCFDLRRQFYSLIVQKAEAQLLDRQVQSAARRVEKERIQLQSGHSTTAQFSRIELDWQNLQIKQRSAAKTFQFTLAEFQRVSGSHTFSADDVPDRLLVPVVDVTSLNSRYEAFTQEGFANSLTAKDSALRQNAVSQEIIINDSHNKPLLNLTVGVTQSPYQNNNNSGIQFTTILFAGVTGSWNIFDNFETQGNSRALLAKRRVLEAKLADDRLQALNEADNNLNQIDLGLRTLAVLKKRFALLQDDYRKLVIRTASGHAEQVETDSTRDALLETKFQILTSQTEVASAYYAFLTAIFSDPALATYAPAFTRPVKK